MKKSVAPRILGLMDFEEKVESGYMWIGDIKEVDVLGGYTMEWATVLKEREDGLVVGASIVFKSYLLASGI